MLIDDKHIEGRWGFSVAPTTHDIALDNVNDVTLTKEISRGRRGRKNTNYYLNFNLKNGGTEKLTTSNSLMEASADKLLATLVTRNIPIVDNTGDP